MVPLVGDVRKMIMDEGDAMRYSIHPGADKMYHDLRDVYWWPGMKRDVATHISKCLTCSKAKFEENQLIRPEMIQKTTDKVVLIKKRIKAARDRQKSYADNRTGTLIASGSTKEILDIGHEMKSTQSSISEVFRASKLTKKGIAKVAMGWFFGCEDDLECSWIREDSLVLKEWGIEQEEAFQILKDNLCNASILCLLNGSQDFVVLCDASNQGLGCVLLQKGDVRKMIMDEVDAMRYSIHPGADKMYHDLRDVYW
nr:putative reverse transcriptase domain-containing protein [Tanacetum cinerariifolium]